MKNKFNFTKEELLEYLPDFSAGNISDPELSETIRLLIDSDPEFKNEFESIKLTLNFLEYSEPENIPDNYFNNLSVKINQRIENQIPNKETSGFADRVSSLWKILIPVVTIILIVLYFSLSQDDSAPTLSDKDNNEILVKENNNSVDPENQNKLITTPDKDTELSVEIDKLNKDNLKDKDPGSGNKISDTLPFKEKGNNEELYQITSEKSVNNSGTASKEDLNNYFLNSGFADIFEIDESDSDNQDESEELELLNSNNTEELNLQDEFKNLPADEQQEILNILIETQI